MFFFEKKNQKTFATCHTYPISGPGRVRQRAEVFWFFFSKKNTFFFPFPSLRSLKPPLPPPQARASEELHGAGRRQRSAGGENSA
jgi:hypothetical protein